MIRSQLEIKGLNTEGTRAEEALKALTTFIGAMNSINENYPSWIPEIVGATIRITSVNLPTGPGFRIRVVRRNGLWLLEGGDPLQNLP